MRSGGASRSPTRRRSSHGTRILPSVRRTTTRSRSAPRKRPDTTTGSRAGYSGTRRATTPSRLWSRDHRVISCCRCGVRPCAPSFRRGSVELCLLIGGKNCADLRGLLGLKIGHLRAGSVVDRPRRLRGLAQLQLLRDILVADRLDLRLLGVGKSDVLEQHPAHSAATAGLALTLLCRVRAPWFRDSK